MTILATFKPELDGRTIVRVTTTIAVLSGQAAYSITFTFPELRLVEQLLHLEFGETTPPTLINSYAVQNKTYTGNTVGMTLNLNPVAGTTLIVEAVGLGI